MPNSLLEDVIETGLREKCKNFKNEFINIFRKKVIMLFEKTKDPELIQKKLLDFINEYILEDYR